MTTRSIDLRARFMINGDNDGYSLYLFHEGKGWVNLSSGLEWEFCDEPWVDDPDEEDKPADSDIVMVSAFTGGISDNGGETFFVPLNKDRDAPRNFFQRVADFLGIKEDE